MYAENLRSFQLIGVVHKDLISTVQLVLLMFFRKTDLVLAVILNLYSLGPHQFLI
jgi:hypothetical protein